MKLTKRQRQILEWLATEDNPEDGSDELVESDGEVWVGAERTNHATLIFFLRHALVKELSVAGYGSTVYVITEYGRKVLVDPDFEVTWKGKNA